MRRLEKESDAQPVPGGWRAEEPRRQGTTLHQAVVLSVQTGYGGARSAPGNIILRGGQKDNRAMQSLKRSIFFSTNSESAQIASTVSLYKLSENV